MHGKKLYLLIIPYILASLTPCIASSQLSHNQDDVEIYNPIRADQFTTAPEQVRNDENPTCCSIIKQNAVTWGREAIHPCSGFPDLNDENPTCCSIIKQGAWSFGYDIRHPNLCCHDYIADFCGDDEDASTVVHNNQRVTTVIRNGDRFHHAQQPLHPATKICRKLTCLCCCFSFLTAMYGTAVFVDHCSK